MEAIKIDSHSPQRPGSFFNWRLNQQLTAVVLGPATAGRSEIRIDGNTFTATPSALLATGDTLILRMISMYPAPKFSVLPGGSTLELCSKEHKSEVLPATTVSTALALGSPRSAPDSLSKLLFFMSSLGSAAFQSLPVGVQGKLLELQKIAININQLSDRKKLKHALAKSGLMLESSLLAQNPQANANSQPLRDDFKAVLFGLFRNLQQRGALRDGSPTMLNGNIGLAAYAPERSDSLSMSLPMQLMRAVEDSLASIVTAQNRTLNESTDSRQSWFFQLPVASQSSLRSIPISVFRERSDKTIPNSAWHYGVEFTIELPRNGTIRAQLSMSGPSVSAVLECDQKSTLRRLRANAATLGEGLNDYGLLLESFECRLAAESLS